MNIKTRLTNSPNKTNIVAIELTSLEKRRFIRRVACGAPFKSPENHKVYIHTHNNDTYEYVYQQGKRKKEP